MRLLYTKLKYSLNIQTFIRALLGRSNRSAPQCESGGFRQIAQAWVGGWVVGSWLLCKAKPRKWEEGELHGGGGVNCALFIPPKGSLMASISDAKESLDVQFIWVLHMCVWRGGGVTNWEGEHTNPQNWPSGCY